MNRYAVKETAKMITFAILASLAFNFALIPLVIAHPMAFCLTLLAIAMGYAIRGVYDYNKAMDELNEIGKKYR